MKQKFVLCVNDGGYPESLGECRENARHSPQLARRAFQANLAISNLANLEGDMGVSRNARCSLQAMDGLPKH